MASPLCGRGFPLLVFDLSAPLILLLSSLFVWRVAGRGAFCICAGVPEGFNAFSLAVGRVDCPEVRGVLLRFFASWMLRHRCGRGRNSPWRNGAQGRVPCTGGVGCRFGLASEGGLSQVAPALGGLFSVEPSWCGIRGGVTMDQEFVGGLVTPEGAAAERISGGRCPLGRRELARTH